MTNTQTDPVALSINRPIVLVGLMGSGKTKIGRRLAAALSLPFFDSDAEFENAAGCTVSDYFTQHGEPAFREGERRVIGRLLDGPPCVLATGGGAYLDQETRAKIKQKAISIWLKADLDLLVRRTANRDHRPLLKQGDPRQILAQLIEVRSPIYAQADIHVDSADVPPDVTLNTVVAALTAMPRTLMQNTPLLLDLGDRSYAIHIDSDLLDRAGELSLPLMTGQRAVIITDENVAPLYLDRVQASFAKVGIRTESIIVAPGEDSKSFATLEQALDRLLDAKVERSTLIVALGGGVIGDLVGFAASICLRGLDFIQIPTTLLSQVDSSVGGKTGINTRQGKNLVGTFYQPRLVLADLTALNTLTRRHVLAGYAEVVKYGCIDDEPFFAWLEQNAVALLNGDLALRAQAVRHACLAKARTVAADEREGGIRALLNLGHTFGHALEAETGFSDELLHGEAVALGMVMAFALSVDLGLAHQADLDRLIAHFTQVGLPTALPRNRNWEPDRLIDHMAGDKKIKDGRITFVLAKGIGHSFLTRDVPADRLRALLTRFTDPQ